MSTVKKIAQLSQVFLSPLENWMNDQGPNANDLIRGKIYQQAAPSPYHSAVQGDLRAILSTLRAKKTKDGSFEKGAWFFATEVGVLYDEKNACTHDLAGWKTDRFSYLPSKGPISVYPDWVCEITSTNWINDTIYKKEILEKAKVPYYWIISPCEKILIVMILDEKESKLVLSKTYNLKDLETQLINEKIPPFELAISLHDIFNY